MNKKFIATILLLFLALSVPVCAEVKDTVLTFDRNLLRMETVTDGDEAPMEYVKMTYGQDNSGVMGCVETAGHPCLPMCHYTISLPHDAMGILVTCDVTPGSTIALEHEIYPAQHPIPTGIGYDKPAFCKPTSEAYTGKFPNELVSITDISCFGNGERLVGVDVSPVTYYPQEGKCELAQSVLLHVTYSMDRMTRAANVRGQDKCPTSLPFYVYCVITSRKLSDAFTRLIGWERQKGLDAGVVCVEDILSDPAIKGDTVSHIYDDAGKVRQYLQYAYKFGSTKYVLFGGNDSIVPIRYGAGRDNTYAITGDSEALHIPADFYFSELNSNWNKDGDEFYGEPQDLDDYAAELQVGRLLCVKSADIENYTEKLLRYEANPGNGDYGYLRKAFYSQADQMQEGHQAEVIASELKGIFPDQTIISEEPGYNAQNTTYPTGNDAIAVMKEHFGFVSWFNHGHPMAITTKTNGLSSVPYGVGSVTGNIPWIVREDCNGLDSLGNKDYPMIAYSVSCSITPFDYYEEIYKGKTNIGQSFTLGKDYGGPALIGNTRVGWVGTSYKMQSAFNSFLPNHTIGEALNMAKLSNAYSKHHHALVVNIIGTPDIYIWTDIPKKIDVSVSDSVFSLAPSSEGKIWASVNNLTDIVPCVNEVVAGKSQNIVENSIMTLTGFNCLPRILPAMFKNLTLNGRYHLFTSDVRAGSLKDNAGKVVVCSGSNVVIENSGTFEMRGNVVIEKGATFAIKKSEILR